MDCVQVTNQSSLISKYSMQKYGYVKDNTYYQYFISGTIVKVRRAPLIHWYQVMDHIIQHTVKTYLSHGRIFNIGAGMDTHYFRLLEHGILFKHYIDLDFCETIHKKSTIIRSTEELRKMLINENPLMKSGGEIQSELYSTVGVDITNTLLLDILLSKRNITNTESPNLLISECVMSYLNPERANEFIHWASKKFTGPTLFVLYEQNIRPFSESSPLDSFSLTMLDHFDKIQSPLLSSKTYPSIESQQSRFVSLGWEYCVGITLYELWCFLSTSQRPDKAKSKFLYDLYFEENLTEILLSKEAFDEWEEWDLKMQHYLVFFSTNNKEFYMDLFKGLEAIKARTCTALSLNPVVGTTTEFVPEIPKESLNIWGHVNILFDSSTSLFTFGGYGISNNHLSSGRTNSIYKITYDNIKNIRASKIEVDLDAFPQPCSRIYHALGSLGNDMFLLCGGRSNPLAPLNDCWVGEILHEGHHPIMWRRSTDLDFGRYRHSVEAYHNMVIISGGISVVEGKQKILSDILTFDISTETWTFINVTSLHSSVDVKTLMRYSHTMHFLIIKNDPLIERLKRFKKASYDKVGRLYLIGGRTFNDILPPALILVPLLDNNIISIHDEWIIVDTMLFPEFFTKTLDQVRFEEVVVSTRYAHTSHLIYLNESPAILLVGGIISYSMNKVHYPKHNLVLLDVESNAWTIVDSEYSRGLTLVNHSSVYIKDSNQVLSIGGGFTCFSMGTFFSNTTIIPVEELYLPQLRDFSSAVPIKFPTSDLDFEVWFANQVPLVFRGFPLGSLNTWSIDDLTMSDNDVVEALKVSVHESPSSSLYFHQKNFQYKVIQFTDLIKLLYSEQNGPNKIYYYMRAIGEDPRNEVADLQKSFPLIANAFQLPTSLIPNLKDKLFSSILRLSSPGLKLWIHYDVLDNVLCQIWGEKRVLLWHPTCLPYLYIEGSSSTIREDPLSLEGEKKYPLLKKARPLIVYLKPGDIIFIPALWFHHVTALNEPSLAINLFWREEVSHAEKLYDSKDLYGNKDLLPAQRAIEKVQSAIKDCNKLPKRYLPFYYLKMKQILTEYEESLSL